jgi:hypothetical protein
MRNMMNAYKILVGINHSENLGVGKNITLTLFEEIWWEVWTGFWPRTGAGGGSCNSINCGDFVDYLSLLLPASQGLQAMETFYLGTVVT